MRVGRGTGPRTTAPVRLAVSTISAADWMDRVIELHRQVLDGKLASSTALNELQTLSYGNLVDGYWHGQPGIESIKEEFFEGVKA